MSKIPSRKTLAPVASTATIATEESKDVASPLPKL